MTGRERYTLDVALPGLAHLALVRSPYPHAYVISVDASAALAVPGVLAVYSYRDSPDVHYSTGRHEDIATDPFDTVLFDRVVRFAGQRVAAVVAETAGLAQQAASLVRVTYGTGRPSSTRSRRWRQKRRWCTGTRRRRPGSPTRRATSRSRCTAGSAT